MSAAKNKLAGLKFVRTGDGVSNNLYINQNIYKEIFLQYQLSFSEFK